MFGNGYVIYPFSVHVITYPCWDKNKSMLLKWAIGEQETTSVNYKAQQNTILGAICHNTQGLYSLSGKTSYRQIS